MSLESDVRQLGRATPLASLPREALQLIAFASRKRRLAEGEMLFSAGDPAAGAYLVLEGEIALTAEGREKRAFAGALIGEQAMLVETRRPSDARAVTQSEVVEITRETFRRVLHEFPQSAAALRQGALQRTGRLIADLERVRRRGFAHPSAR